MTVFSTLPRVRPLLLGMSLSTALLLSACATGPASDASRIPDQRNAETQQQGLFSQPVDWTREQPGCKGHCPKLVMKSLSFPGQERLNQLIEHGLLAMSWIDEDKSMPYDSFESYERYFWKTAGRADETDFIASTPYRNKDLTVLELKVGMYKTGMAHGITGTQYLIWDNESQKVLTLDDLLRRGASEDFEAVLRKAHAQWLKDTPAVQEDPANFNRMWPFVPSDNVALTDSGLDVKYQSYEIAPYSFGQPTLHIPYTQLKNILRPEYLPPNG